MIKICVSNLDTHIFCTRSKNKGERVIKMHKEEKKEEKSPVNWEICDPKPPVIQSGRMENRRENRIDK